MFSTVEWAALCTFVCVWVWVFLPLLFYFRFALILGRFVPNNLTPKGPIYSEQNCTREHQKHVVRWGAAMLMGSYEHVDFEDGHLDGLSWVSTVICAMYQTGNAPPHCCKSSLVDFCKTGQLQYTFFWNTFLLSLSLPSSGLTEVNFCPSLLSFPKPFLP